VSNLVMMAWHEATCDSRVAILEFASSRGVKSGMVIEMGACSCCRNMSAKLMVRAFSRSKWETGRPSREAKYGFA